MRPVILLSLTVLLLVATAACQRKKPVTAAPDLEVAAAETSVPAAAAPAPVAADSDPWAGDLEAVNRRAREEGLLGDVYFDYDRAELRAEARERLTANGRFLAQHPEFEVVIEGHCDERGTADYNLALGQSRASSALQYVGTFGVGDDRARVISYGKERPVCTDPAEDCWWKNRRAAFVIVGRRAG